MTQLDIGDIESQVLGMQSTEVIATPWWVPAAAGLGLIGIVAASSSNSSNNDKLTSQEPVNKSPVAVDDIINVVEDSTVNLTPLVNDTDSDGDALRVTQINGEVLNGSSQIITVANGIVTINASGDINFSPTTNFNGETRFSYTISDGIDTSTANQVIKVISVNDAPSASDNTLSTNEDVALVFSTADFGFNDVDGDGLSAVVIDGLPSSGTLVLSGNAVTVNQVITAADITAGNLIFTPAANTNGTGYASFSFSVQDDSGASNNQSVSQTISIDVTAVNDNPIAKPDSFITAEDTQLTGNLLADNGNGVDSDIDSSTLQVTAGTLTTTAGGSVIIDTNGDFSYTPATNFTGADSFSYTLTDGDGGSATGSVNLTVGAINDAPILDLDADYSAAMGSGFSTSFTEDCGAVAITDTDLSLSDIDYTTLESATVSITNLQDGSAESLSIDLTGTAISSSYDDVSGVLTLTGSDSIANYQQALLSLTYNNSSQNPTSIDRSISIVVNDGDTNSNVAISTVSIIAVNDSPTGEVTIDGLSAVGETLIANTSTLADIDGLGTLSYQWYQDGTAITGATDRNYTLINSDLGTEISVEISYTDGGGTAESVTSNPTQAVTTLGINLADIEADTVQPSNNSGFVINGQAAGDVSGYSVSAAGDVNGDGLADVIVGAYGANSAAGKSYVVFGKTDNTAIDLNAVESGIGGFVINGQAVDDCSGSSVSAAGDVNGDGLADLLVGAPYADFAVVNQNAGKSYVIFGSTTGTIGLHTQVDELGTDGNNTLTSDSTSQTLVGGMGDNTLIGNGGHDVLYGGSGNDTFILNADNIAALSDSVTDGNLASIDGGTGIDIINFYGSGINFDLTAIANTDSGNARTNSRLDNVEIIDITGSGNNTLTLELKDVLDMAAHNVFESAGANAGNHQLMVRGDAGDTLDLADGIGTTSWSNSGSSTIDGANYDVWQHDTSAALIYVDQNVAII